MKSHRTPEQYLRICQPNLFCLKIRVYDSTIRKALVPFVLLSFFEKESGHSKQIMQNTTRKQYGKEIRTYKQSSTYIKKYSLSSLCLSQKYRVSHAWMDPDEALGKTVHSVGSPSDLPTISKFTSVSTQVRLRSGNVEYVSMEVGGKICLPTI